MLNVPMPRDISKEEQLKLQKSESDRMFNFAEKWIMKYMCILTNSTMDDLFTIADVETSHPVYTAPIKELNNARVEFSLDIVDHDYKLDISDNLLNDARVTHVLGFIYHSIKEVFNAVVNNSIKKDSAKLIYDSSFHLEINDESLTFFPIYMYPQRRREIMLIQMRDEIFKVLRGENVNSELDPKIIDEMSAKHTQICKLIEGINYDNNKANVMEIKKNEELHFCKRLGIKMKIVQLNEN
jgi:hypothetical protein